MSDSDQRDRHAARTSRTWIYSAALAITTPFIWLQPALCQQFGPVSVTERLRLGALDGEEAHVFGLVADVAVDGEGHLYVLDRAERRLQVFDPRGELLASAGGPGQGPGEYLLPASLAWDDEGSGRIYVIARRNARLYGYRLSSAGLKREVSVRLEMDAEDLCAAEGRLFLFGFHNGKLVHEFDTNGRPVASFGEPFLADPIAGPSMTSGHIACVPEEGLVVVAAQQLPVVRAYTFDGELIWSRRIDDFRQMRVEVTERGHVRLSEPASGGAPDIVTSLVRLGSGVLLVQFGRMTPAMGSPEEIVEVQSRLWSTSDGREVVREARLPRLDAVRGSYALAHPTSPFSQVVVYDYALTSAGGR